MLSRCRRAAGAGCHRSTTRPWRGAERSTGSPSSPCRKTAGHASTSRPSSLTAQCPCQAGGGRGRRPGGLVRRWRWLVNEGASSNAWIVTADGRLSRRRPIAQILRRRHPRCRSRHCPAARAGARRKAFQRRRSAQGARSIRHLRHQRVTPVVRIDGEPVGKGSPARLRATLRAALQDAQRAGQGAVA